MKYYQFFVAAVALLLITSSLTAAPLWQSNEIFLLHGKGYEVNSDKQSVMTLEHASGWSFGDVFAFVDINKYHHSNESTDYYGEISPRLSYNKLSNNKINGTLQDILLATTLEFGKGDVEGLLLGVGFDFKFPGFNYVNVNIYRRFINTERDGETIQITPAWSLNFSQNVSFEGYADWNITSDDNYKENFHFNPRLKYTIPVLSNKAAIGLEYSYWKNKYGIKSSSAFKTDQEAISLFISLIL
ncbi:MAG: hypothetical protein HQL46_00595 [Gammaproteobacteria bacterium]|nr:hypothetical protein [Gammaproteobacteria bacterium]